MERGWGDIDSLDVRLNVERMRIMRIRDRFVFASKRRERRSCRCRAVRFTPVDVGKARKPREILIYLHFAPFLAYLSSITANFTMANKRYALNIATNRLDVQKYLRRPISIARAFLESLRCVLKLDSTNPSIFYLYSIFGNQ